MNDINPTVKALRIMGGRHWLEEIKQNKPSFYELTPKEFFTEKFRYTSPLTLIEQYGKDYQDYLKKTLTAERRLNASYLSAQLFSSAPKGTLTKARDLCALSMGYRACGELTSAMHTDALEKGYPVMRVAIGRSGYRDGDDAHIFLVCAQGHSVEDLLEALQKQPFEALKELDCLVIDPFLNEVFVGRDFDSSALSSFLQSMNYTELRNIGLLPPATKEVAQRTVKEIRQLAKKIEIEALKILDSPKNTNQKIQRLEWLLNCASGH